MNVKAFRLQIHNSPPLPPYPQPDEDEDDGTIYWPDGDEQPLSNRYYDG